MEKYSFLAVVLCLLASSFAFGAGGDMGGGSGTAGDPYLIEDLADFDVFADPINSATYWASGVHTKLACDPNLISEPYTTAVIAPDGGDTFQGVFDGDGHTISNLTIDTAGADNNYLGLFGKIEGAAAEVKNLGIVNCNITGGANSRGLGGLCGSNYGTITNCYASASVDGSRILGGLCGSNYGTITDSHASGSVTRGDILGGLCGDNGGTITNCHSSGSVDGGYMLGGLCGSNQDTLTNCYATGSVDGETDYLGGLCGKNNGPISNCYATGSVAGSFLGGGDRLGGLCGSNISTLSNCYATGSVTGGDGFSVLGGLCGRNEFGTISNCYSTGSVAGGAGSNALGGLCGDNGGTISNCYSGGSVEGNDYLGGLCGFNGGAISNCYSGGSVAGNDYLGGLCGYNFGPTANCFWDTDTSGISDPEGGLAGTDTDGMTGMTTIQMQTESNFTDAGWDFDPDDGDEADWWINNERDYPRLDWQPFGDLNNDSHVNVFDFGVMSAAWGASDGDANYNSVCELSGDNTINAADLFELAGMWMAGPF